MGCDAAPKGQKNSYDTDSGGTTEFSSKRPSAFSAGQQNGRTGSDDQSMLKMGRERMIAGAERPAVFIGKHAARAAGDDRFHRDDQPLVHDLASLWIRVVWDVGKFMNCPPDAVSA